MVAFSLRRNAASENDSEPTLAESRVLKRLQSQGPATFRRVDIAIRNGVLVLSGTVDSYIEKALAVQIARRNVFELDIADELHVNPTLQGSIDSLNRLSALTRQ
ncbi:MAG: hypothetical protein C0478_10065 [Planctomyces sp.]|jgi:hypothetical protein|nr:hypothetical protein [Planctomyces sp.]